MGSVIDYVECSCCGNKEMISDYHYSTEELYESCDVCGYYHTVKLTNKYLDGNYPEDWQPKYDEVKSKGYPVKIFNSETKAFAVCVCEEKDLENLINNLQEDENVSYFGVTHQGKNGYKTQIFKK
jgi:hypothetical protein